MHALYLGLALEKEHILQSLRTLWKRNKTKEKLKNLTCAALVPLSVRVRHPVNLAYPFTVYTGCARDVAV